MAGNGTSVNSIDTLSSTLGDEVAHITVPITVRRDHKLPFLQRLAFSVGHVLNDLCSAVWFTYLLLYMQQVQLFSSALAGVLLLVGQIADGVATPFVGIESDRDTNWALCRYGKRKTWHLLGTVCVVVSFPMIFTSCLGCDNAHDYAKVIYYSAFIVIFQFGWASVQISHLALIPELTPHSDERCELNAWRYAFTVVSNITVYTITWLFLGLGSSSDSTTFSTNNSTSLFDNTASAQVCPKDASHFRNIVLSVVAIGIVFSIIFHAIVPENSHHSRTSREAAFTSSDGVDYSLRANHLRWYDWFKVSQFYKVGLLYMGTRLTINLTQVYIPFYLQQTLLLSRASIAYIPLLMYVSGFFSSFVMNSINGKIGKKWTFFVGCLVALVGYVWIFVGIEDYFIKYGIYGVCFLLGVSGSTMLITSLAITNDLIGHNTSSGAFVFGAMSLLDKFSNGLTVMAIQSVHDHGPAKCSCYRNVLAIVCGGATVLALFALALLSREDISAKRRRMSKLDEETAPDENRKVVVREDEPLMCNHTINGRNNHANIVSLS